MVLGDIFHGPRWRDATKNGSRIPIQQICHPNRFFKQKFMGELAGFENNPSDWRSRKKMMRTSHLSEKNAATFFHTWEKRLEVADPEVFPLHEGKMSFFWKKKKRQQCRNFMAVSQELQFGKLKKPQQFHLKFHVSTKWHSHQQFTGFPAIGHKVHAYENSGSKWFFSQLDYHSMVVSGSLNRW